MQETKKYWKGLEELNQDPEFLKHKDNEFFEELPLEKVFPENPGTLNSNRRDFLKLFGFGISAATLAACTDSPVKKAIPYLIKPQEITPGVANWYASTCGGCSTGCGVLVKTREGRPIKVEGNNLSFTGGGICSVGQATVLSLYDQARATHPFIGGKKATWAQTDKEIQNKLAAIKTNGGKVHILANTINSPSTLKLIGEFLSAFPGSRLVQYDSVSYAGILEANQISFSKSVIPSYHFENAEVVVSVGADFLGTWLSPVEFSAQYAKGRKIADNGKHISRHIQIEALLSLTGSNADLRIPVKASQEELVILGLYNEVAKKTGASVLPGVEDITPGKMLASIAAELVAKQGKSLVVSGSNDASAQVIVNSINHLLGAYGSTIDLNNYSNQYKGSDKDFTDLVAEMNRGEVSGLIVYNANPVYNHPMSKAFVEGLKKVSLTIATNDRLDETGSLVNYLTPDHHYLESWNDSEAKSGEFTLTQPTIRPIFSTRQFQESLQTWMGGTADFYSYIRNTWEASAFKTQSQFLLFGDFWNNAVHDGVYKTTPGAMATATPSGDLLSASEAVKSVAGKSGKLEVVVYEKLGLKDGTHANNPWLQEFPDPITKVCWDNYVTLAPRYASELNIKQGQMVQLSAGGYSVTLPALLQPGQAYGTAGVALGYGRTKAGKCGDNIGQNAAGFFRKEGNTFVSTQYNAEIKGLSDMYELAQTQVHESMEGRAIVKETTLAEFVNNPGSGNPAVTLVTPEGPQKPEVLTLWDKHDYEKGYHWGMVIDLNSCTGCGACIVSCNAENNVAVVGKHEVLVRREMHWIRLDRYYAEDKTNPDNVDVVFQPMMCQHCDNAPCESVCPVLATVHSAEGLNQQVYNRCVGTRYCANNCPYKVRRFNWFQYAENDKFDYNMNNDLGRMVLNPDVTVRSRGVMEKCTLCVQRIQEGKLNAKKSGHPLEDGKIKTACQAVCPSNAIVFGDKNNPESELSKLLASKRNYQVLEEVKTLPNVSYLTKIRNRKA